MDPREYQKLYGWLGDSIVEGAQEVRRWAGDRLKTLQENNNNNNNAGYASTNYPVKNSGVAYRQPLPSPKTPSSSSFQIPSLNDLQRQQASILRGAESVGSGEYNAVNQWGSEDGTGNKYVFPDGSTSYVGDFREMSQHAGRDLADLTLSEIKELQYDDGSLSMREWVDQGKLHAVGGHQFIKDTLIDVTNGLDPNLKFTPELQDYLAIKLLNERGPDQWVSMRKSSKKITPEQRRILEMPSL